MIFTASAVHQAAPDVLPKARARASMGYKTPFITLQDLEALCRGDEDLEGLLGETVMLCLRYAETVCQFEQIVLSGQEANENGERQRIEGLRSSVHDATIGSINSLSRLLKARGKDNSWIRAVSSQSRASYGKFAILLAFEVVLGKEGQ